ncbi:head-tail adaptor protein [Xinfangfangia sp. D13-10-4-6]|uniref:head-tail adaptor protein n=1 Tax=Pseudogemmobacter hezensis TaxID=2737662 RepID=UPI00155306A1|nr:head-tail adaptor protein [Pseudogemmobacter hezensis]NPD15748.1 head-tail adaptor protein [Pseudogemmobacter hezensis]
MKAGEFNRRVQFQRGTLVDDGLQAHLRWNKTDPSQDNHGAPRWAARKDVSDAERAQAGWIEATVVSRFTVRSSEFTRGLTAKDRLICGGLTFDIQGIKEIGRSELEITATARADL